MARSLGRIFKGFQRLGSRSSIQTQLSSHPPASVSFRTSFVRTVVNPSAFSSKPRDFSLPNSSWGPEMMRLYEHYNSLCEVETEGGEKQEGPWRRLPSYNRLLKYATGKSADCDVFVCLPACLVCEILAIMQRSSTR